MPDQKVIKVLFVTHYREMYGANHSLLQMILELREKGIQPMVMLPFGDTLPDNDLASEFVNHHIPYIEAPIRMDKHQDWKKLIPNYFFARYCKRKAFSVVKDRKFDLIHSNSSTISTGTFIAKKMGIPHVWHLREFGDLDYNLKTPFGKWFQKYLYGGHNYFIAISKKIRDHYQKYIGNQPMKLIYNGIKPSPLYNPSVHDKVEFCIVGRIEPQKGHQEILEAAHELIIHRNILNFHIYIVGGGYQPYLDQLKANIEKSGLSDFVTMTGRQNDIALFLTKMDVGIMASSHEAFGRVTVEYMMAGLPVVASDGGANLEIITDQQTGLIYKSGDTKSLADRMELLIKDSYARQRYGLNGLELAQKQFTSKANSDAVYEIYKDILNVE